MPCRSMVARMSDEGTRQAPESVGNSPTSELRSQTAYIRNRAVPHVWYYDTTLAYRTLAYLWPWTRRTYPGLHAGTAISLGRKLTWASIRHWTAGRHRFPVWAAEALLTHVEAHVSAGTALATELRRHIDVSHNPPRHLSPNLRKRKTDD